MTLRALTNRFLLSTAVVALTQPAFGTDNELDESIIRIASIAVQNRDETAPATTTTTSEPIQRTATALDNQAGNLLSKILKRKNVQENLKALKEMNNDTGKYALARLMMEKIEGVPHDISTGLRLLTEGARQKNPLALTNLAVLMISKQHGFTHGDRPAGLTYVNDAAQMGYVWAQNILGFWLVTGYNDVPKNLNKGLSLLEQAAAQGNVDAQKNLGFWLVTGCNDVPKNVAKGVMFVEQAAAQGNVLAQHNLGIWLVTGCNDVPKNVAKGVLLLEQAAAQGNVNSQRNLGVWLVTGEHDIPKNLNKGLSLLEQAAAQGDFAAQHNLGSWMVTGQYGFTEADYDAGLELLQRSRTYFDFENVEDKRRHAQTADSLKVLYGLPQGQGADKNAALSEVKAYIEGLKNDPQSIFHKTGRIDAQTSEFDNMLRSLEGPEVVPTIMRLEDGTVQQGDYANIVADETYMTLKNGTVVTIFDLFSRVWTVIQNHPKVQEQDILKHSFVKGLAEMIDEVIEQGRRVCMNGKAQRLLSVLQGYCPGIQIDGERGPSAATSLSARDVSSIANDALSQFSAKAHQRVRDGQTRGELTSLLEEEIQNLTQTHASLSHENRTQLLSEFQKGADLAIETFLDQREEEKQRRPL